MKKVWMGIGGMLLVGVVVFLLGPRVAVETTLRPFTPPDDLDAYLAAQEARFDDIIPGTEKTIVWAGEPSVQTPLSLVYLHGFSASRQETSPLAEELAAELGANLFYTRFTGHGRSGEALAEATVNDYLNDTWEAYQIGRQLGERVIIIGVSTGGTAATWLAAQPDVDDLHTLVLISPNFGPADSTAEILTWPWAEQIATALIGPERAWEPANDLQREYWTEQYPTRALLPMMGLVKLARRSDLAAMSAPTLLLYSPDDTTVNPARTEEVAAQFGAEPLQITPLPSTTDTDNHVLAGDIMAPHNTARVQEMILSFLHDLE